MTRHILLLASLVAFSVAGIQAQEKEPQESATLKESQKLYQQGKYTEALDILEPAVEKGTVTYNYYGNLFSTEAYLVRLYKAAHQTDRGVRFLYGQYKSKKDAIARSGKEAALEDALLNLALTNKSLDVAREVVATQKARENFPGWGLSEARISAVEGNRAATIEKLKGYLTYEYADSRTRILAYPEFKSFHGDPDFQNLMIDTLDRFAKLRSKYQLPDLLGGGKSLTLEEMRAQAEVYKQVTDAASGKELGQKLEEADRAINRNLAEHKNDVFAWLQHERQNKYYRLTLARLLVGLNDADLTARVAAEVDQDDFRQFPNQLFYLAYGVARSNPRLARPFLMQMLQLSKGSIFLVQHAMSVDWEGMLFQAFGVAEADYLDDLLKIAAGRDTVEAPNALKLLCLLLEPRVVPILTEKITRAASSHERRQFIDHFGMLPIPQTLHALESLQQSAQKAGESDTQIVRLMKDVKPSTVFEFLERGDGIVISEPGMKKIFYSNLISTHGSETSFVMSTLYLSATPEDIPTLRRVRSSILHRMSDESFADYGIVTVVMMHLFWQN
jgi:hypothetical protein